MYIIKSGSKVQIYSGEDIITYNSLPIKTYMLNFSMNSGFYLSIVSNFSVKANKIYGDLINKITKTFIAFQNSANNLGILLSGVKGSGKTLFIQKMSQLALTNNLPIILINKYYEGMEFFINSIEQEAVIVFDEFEKNFSDEEQEKLLTLFDGINNQKKLFLVTCNSVSKISDYFLNRPGRIHYHFKLGVLKTNEIRKYLDDNLKSKYKYYINELLTILFTVSVTYDILRAIVFELNQGYDIFETLNDLNIESPEYLKIKIIVETDKNKIYQKHSFSLPIKDKKTDVSICLHNRDNGSKFLNIYFNRKDTIMNDDELIVPVEKCKYNFYDEETEKDIITSEKPTTIRIYKDFD